MQRYYILSMRKARPAHLLGAAIAAIALVMIPASANAAFRVERTKQEGTFVKVVVVVPAAGKIRAPECKVSCLSKDLLARDVKAKGRGRVGLRLSTTASARRQLRDGEVVKAPLPVSFTFESGREIFTHSQVTLRP